MAKGSAGFWQGAPTANVDLVPLIRQHEINKNPGSFLRSSENMIIKKVSIVAPIGTRLQVNNDECVTPSKAFELSYGMIDIEHIIFPAGATEDVTISYVY